MSAAPAAMPSLFVPHGAPTFALRPGVAGATLARAASRLPQPRAIIVVSAHWDTPAPTVGLAQRPETIHDFWGFPSQLYRINYPATGCSEAGEEVIDSLKDAGFAAGGDTQRGLDHGAWIPLRLMFPHADVPVIPLSIQSHLGPAHHFAIGRALAPLAARGFLLVASGNLTHNLGDFRRICLHGGEAPAYVREFADWFWRRVKARDLAALLDYRRRAPHAARAHPDDDHLMPFFVALGAGGVGSDHGRVRRLHAGIDDFVLAMDAFAFYPPQSQQGD